MRKVVFEKPKCVTEEKIDFCAGCTHAQLIHLLGRVIDEMGLQEETILVGGIGCGTQINLLLDVDYVCSPHGRAPAVATGVKRCNKDNFVLTYQGDGDATAIGAGELVNAANRGEKFTVIMVNNALYGNTGGQMAPTTRVGQVTKTSPFGRNPEESGYPMKMLEAVSQFDAAKFTARVALDTPAHIRQAAKVIKKAFECQKKGLGFSMVEVLSICPTNWKLSPLESAEVLRNETMKIYPLGIINDFEEDA